MNDHKTMQLNTEDVQIIDASEGLNEPSDCTVSISAQEIAKLQTQERPEMKTAHLDQSMLQAIHDKEADFTEMTTEAIDPEVLLRVQQEARAYRHQKQRMIEATSIQWINRFEDQVLPSVVLVHLSDLDSYIYKLGCGLNPLFKAHYPGAIGVYIPPTISGLERIMMLTQAYRWMKQRHYVGMREYLMTLQSPWQEHSDGLGQLIMFEPGTQEHVTTQVVGNLGHAQLSIDVIEGQCVSSMLTAYGYGGSAVVLTDASVSAHVQHALSQRRMATTWVRI